MLTTIDTPSTGAAQAAPLAPTLAQGEPPAFRVFLCYTPKPNGHIEAFGLSHSQAIANALCLRHPEDSKVQSEEEYLRQIRVAQLGVASREDFILFAAGALESRLELAQLAAAEGWSDVDQTYLKKWLDDCRPAREAVARG